MNKRTEKNAEIISKFKYTLVARKKNRHCRSLSVCVLCISFYPSMLTVHGRTYHFSSRSTRSTEQPMCAFYIGKKGMGERKRAAHTRARTHQMNLEGERDSTRAGRHVCACVCACEHDGCLLRLGTTKIVLFHTKDHRFFCCNGKMYSPAKKPIEKFIYSCAFNGSDLCRQSTVRNTVFIARSCVRIFCCTAMQPTFYVSILCLIFFICFLFFFYVLADRCACCSQIWFVFMVFYLCGFRWRIMHICWMGERNECMTDARLQCAVFFCREKKPKNKIKSYLHYYYDFQCGCRCSLMLYVCIVETFKCIKFERTHRM